MIIGHNIPALLTHLNMKNNNYKLAAAMQRLTTGSKINSAKDDAAGLTIANKLAYQVGNLNKASENATNGISLVQTADGALSEMHNMLQRMRELAVQAGTSSLTEDDRAKIQSEIDELTDEIDSLANRTEYNKIKLLAGEASRITEMSPNAATPLYISHDVTSGTFTFNITSVSTTAGQDATITIPASADTTNTPGFSSNATYTADGNQITVTGTGGQIIQFCVTQTASPVTLSIKDYGPIMLQVGPNYNMAISVEIPKLNAETLGLVEYQNNDKYRLLDYETMSGASNAIKTLDNAIKTVSIVRTRMGAYQNRMEATVRSLDTAAENTEAARSLIQDTDMAREMTEYTSRNVMYQAGLAILSQANQRPGQIIQLLQ